MRTTIDLPDELHGQAMAIARDSGRTFSQTVACLVSRGLTGPARTTETELPRSKKTGLPTIAAGRVVTSEDVRSLEDE